MCGITGILYPRDGRAVSLDELKQSCDTLVHRGPDDEGFFIDGHVGLGMRRLNVIDLVSGHQPIANEDGRFWIVFNGEIYNYRTLRAELEDKGHKFATNTDTETIVHAYEEYGAACVHKLNGMFAFAIWDRAEQRLFLARDRMGVKPLYYYAGAACFAFASEIKALLAFRDVPRTLDLEALDSFLTFEYVPAPLSIFQGVAKLPPGHTLTIQDGKCRTEPYWDLAYPDPSGHGDQAGEEAEQVLLDLLKDAVRLRLISDVPLGAFLSGGIDSSALVALMAELVGGPIKTFSIGFDDPSYNELRYAREVATRFGTDHHELTIRPDVVDLAERLVWHLDEPFADVSAFPTFLVSKLAREHVTVVLSGDGGDELFAGYEWYVADRAAGWYQGLPGPLRGAVRLAAQALPPSSRKKGPINKVKRFVEGASLDESLQHFRWCLFLPEGQRAQLLTEGVRRAVGRTRPGDRFVEHLGRYPQADRLWQQQYADMHTYLPDDILVKVDRMSMANSLEARTPYLDYRVVELAASLGSREKLRGWSTKRILKRCMAGKLPPEILGRKKEGFSIPMKNWLRGELSGMMRDLLAPDDLRRDGLFESAYVERLKTEHLDGTANHSHQLWSLMVFQMWKRQFLS